MLGNPFPLSRRVAVIAEGIRGGVAVAAVVEEEGGRIKEESGSRQKVHKSRPESRRDEDRQL